MAAAGRNGPLAPYKRSCALRRCIKWMGDNPPSKRVYFFGVLRVCMAKTLLLWWLCHCRLMQWWDGKGQWVRNAELLISLTEHGTGGGGSLERSRGLRRLGVGACVKIQRPPLLGSRASKLAAERDVMHFLLSREKIKKYPTFFCSILCYVSNVTFLLLTSKVCVGPQN